MESHSAPNRTHPFDLAHPEKYARWRESKLELHPTRIEDLIVEIRDPRRLTDNEANAILDRCRRANMAIYASRSLDDPDKEIPRQLGRRLGLNASGSQQGRGRRRHQLHNRSGRCPAPRLYPVQHRSHRLAYRRLLQRLAPARSMPWYCTACTRRRKGGDERPAGFRDRYILLRDRDPELHPQPHAPSSHDHPRQYRGRYGATSRTDGPGVLPANPDGHLHMRYTDRTRSILWRDDPDSRGRRSPLSRTYCIKKQLGTSAPSWSRDGAWWATTRFTPAPGSRTARGLGVCFTGRVTTTGSPAPDMTAFIGGMNQLLCR